MSTAPRDKASQAGIPPGMPTGPTVADELARVRAQLDAAHRELGRLRRHTRHGTCACRDEAAQAWADNDVLHDRLRRYQEMHAAQAATIRSLRNGIEALRAPLDAAVATAHRPVSTQPQSLWTELFRRRTR